MIAGPLANIFNCCLPSADSRVTEVPGAIRRSGTEPECSDDEIVDVWGTQPEAPQDTPDAGSVEAACSKLRCPCEGVLSPAGQCGLVSALVGGGVGSVVTATVLTLVYDVAAGPAGVVSVAVGLGGGLVGGVVGTAGWYATHPQAAQGPQGPALIPMPPSASVP